jgi:putative sterol carrier protein
MTPKTIFEEQIAGRLADPDHGPKAREIDSVYQFNVTGDEGGSWVVDLKQGKVSSGTSDSADCTITIGDQDLVNLVEGKVPGFQLWSMGRLQVQGNIGLAMKLGQVLGAA